MRSRRPSVLDWLIPVGLAVGAAAVLWHGLVTLPREYADLAGRGVPVRVQIISCGSGQGGDSRGYGCRLETDYEGHVHRWKVDRDVRAQAGPDGAGNGLVDPLHPARSALAEDVDRRAAVPGKTILVAGLFGVLALLTGTAAWARRRPQRPE
jgi:hypothetical protein